MSEGICNASIAPYPPGSPVRRCSREVGHYDETVEPTFGEDGWTSDPGGWHVTAGPEPTVWCDRAMGARPHSDAPEDGLDAEESRPDRSVREKLVYFLEQAQYLEGKSADERRAEATRLVDEYAHELIDRARRGVHVFEDHVGGFQYARDVRENLDVVDPTTPDPDDWDF